MLQKVQIAILLACAAAISAAQTITTVAGTDWVFPASPLPASSAPLGRVQAIAIDPAGNYYIADDSNQLILKVDSTGSMQVVAGNGATGYSGDNGPATSAALNNPYGIAVDLSGNLYIADALNNRIRMVTPGGIISTVAGTGTVGFSGDNGPATAAKLSGPTGIAVDSAGNLYIADAGNSRIREVLAGGVILTIAGNGVEGFGGDNGLAIDASFSNPRCVALDSLGNLYIGDTNNNRIRMVTPGGIITTVAGNGNYGYTGNGQLATSTGLTFPEGVTLDSSGNLYIADTSDRRILMVDPSGSITCVAGDGAGGFAGDGGPATSAVLHDPLGMVVDRFGNIFIADSSNNRVREVRASNGLINTVAGNGLYHYSGDGGPATAASLSYPAAAVADAQGNLYISDTQNQRIRKVNLAGIIYTLAGTGVAGFRGDNGLAVSAEVRNPQDLALDTSGNLYIADRGNNRIRRVTAAGIISTVAGSGAAGFSGDNGSATAAALNSPSGVSVDSSGSLYISDTGNNRIRRVTSAGVIQTIAGNGITGFSGDGGPATSAELSAPLGLTVDSHGNVLFVDGTNRVRKVTPAGIITTVAGTGASGYTGDNRAAIAAELSLPVSVAVTSTDVLFLADSLNNRIRDVATDAVITTAAGSGAAGFSGDKGSAYAASLNLPQGVALDSHNNLLITDTSNNRIRLVSGIGAPAAATPTVVIDLPAVGSSVTGLISVAGWANDNTTGIGGSINPGSLTVSVDGVVYGDAAYGLPRPDVCGSMPGRAGCPNVGYSFSLDTSPLAAGLHTVTVSAANDDVSPGLASATTTFNVASGALPGPPIVTIDSPTSGLAVTGDVTVAGWALDNAAGIGTAIHSVQVSLDGVALGNATYGLPRADVCRNLPGRPGCPNVGFNFQLNSALLTAGAHTLAVTAADSDPIPDSGSASVVFTVQPSLGPAVKIQSPLPGLAFAPGAIVPVTGWALDNFTSIGTPIDPNSLQVKVDGAAIGSATYGIANPVACVSLPSRPGCPNVGYAFPWKTAGLSAGPHVLTVSASDTDPAPLTGTAAVNFTILSSGSPPSVFIDLPAANTAVSGIVTVAGWAIDNTQVIGSAISSVQVSVDGVPVGFATYGVPRADVCRSFPNRPNCPNVGYTFSLNTATLTQGVHTLTVSAADSDTNPDMGSATIGINVSSGPPAVFIDTPANGSTITGLVTVAGWAIDNAAGIGTLINAANVQVKVDGEFVGDAIYGVRRADVCHHFPGRPGCPNVGYTFTLNTSTLAPGPHTLTVQAADTDPTPDSGSASSNVNVQ